VGSNHYSNWHCIKWSIQHVSYGVREDACIQPKHAAEKKMKKKKHNHLKGTYVYLPFVYKFSRFIFPETHTENFTFCHLMQTGSLIFLAEIEVLENKMLKKVKRS